MKNKKYFVVFCFLTPRKIGKIFTFAETVSYGNQQFSSLQRELIQGDIGNNVDHGMSSYQTEQWQ